MAKKRVTIVGGGIAGLTAAWRLADRDYEVTLYEMKDEFGGDLGSVKDERGQSAAKRGDDLTIHHDVYPHMYLPSYRNFFQIVEEVTGKPRADNFEEITNVKQLTRGEFPKFRQLTNTFSMKYLFKNLYSGVLTPLDMFIFGYANYDLLAESLQSTALLDQMSVNGFMHSRPYMTRPAAEALDFWIDLVWGIKSYETSATAYQQYMASGFPDPTPALWFLRGSTYNWLIEPMTEALEAKGVTLHTEVGAVGVVCENRRITQVELAPFTFDEDTETYIAGESFIEEIEDIVLAVPAPVLDKLVKTGESKRRIIDALPELAHLGELRQVHLPVLHLYFNRKLPGFPKEPTSFVGAKYGLAFTDISENWKDIEYFADHTVIALSASDPMQLPGPTWREDSAAMVKELSLFIPEFTMGEEWGDSDDIDWRRSHFGSNLNNQLFVNTVGSHECRPPASLKGVDNLCIAGDFVKSDVGMATVEAAVVGGLQAAQALVDRDGRETVDIIPEKHWSPAVFVALRWLLGPSAYTAKFLSTVLGGFFGNTVTEGTVTTLPPTIQPPPNAEYIPNQQFPSFTKLEKSGLVRKGSYEPNPGPLPSDMDQSLTIDATALTILNGDSTTNDDDSASAEATSPSSSSTASSAKSTTPPSSLSGSLRYLFTPTNRLKR